MRVSARVVGLTALLIGAAVAPAAAEQVEKGSVGVGIVLGEPTGVCAKVYLKDDQAIQGALGLTFVSGGFQVHADYVFHPWILEERADFTMPVYLGPGISMMQHNAGRGGDNDFRLGARLVGGLLFDFKEIPLDVFA